MRRPPVPRLMTPEGATTEEKVMMAFETVENRNSDENEWLNDNLMEVELYTLIEASVSIFESQATESG